MNEKQYDEIVKMTKSPRYKIGNWIYSTKMKILFWLTEKRANLYNKHYGELKLPDSYFDILKNLNKAERYSRGISPHLIILNGKDCSYFKMEWDNYIKRYNEITNNLNWFTRWFLEVKPRTTLLNTIKNVSIIYNQHNHVNDSCVKVLGNNMKVIKKQENSSNIPTIEFKFMEKKQRDKNFYFRLV